MEKSGLTHNGKSLLYIAFAIMLALIIMNITIPDSLTNVGDITLTKTGQTAMAILLFALVLWVTEAIPFHVTGLLAVLLMALFKVDTFKSIVKAGFGSDIFIFFLGVLVLSSFITRSGFGKRISMFILSKTGNSTSMIVLGFLIVGALLSMWLTEMAVAAMLMPLAKAILVEEKVKPLKSNFGKALMIASAWGPVIGGVGTPAGSGTNPLAVGFLKEMAGVNISFLDWMLFGVPSVLLLILPTWGIIMMFFKPEMKTLSRSKDDLNEEYRNLPSMDKDEKTTMAIFLLTIGLWLTTPLLEKWLELSIPISMPILFTVILLFFPNVSSIKWKEVEREVPWSGILLVLTGISVGMMLYQTGAASWMSVILLAKVGGLHPFMMVLAMILIVSLLKIAFTSNTVTGTIIIPIVIALAQNLGIPPIAIALPAALTSSLAFILVTSSPTNVIPYSAGYFTIADMAKAGLVLTIVASLIMAVTIYVIGSFINIY